MRYMLLICTDESTEQPPLGPAELALVPEIAAWKEEAERRGLMRASQRLRPSSDATAVRLRDGELLVTDGPFAETKEQIGGYSIIECKDLDEAIEVAAKHPAASSGTVEVRPIWDA